MTREELKDNISGMTWDDMFEYIYDFENRICENCIHGTKEYGYDGFWCDVLKHSAPHNYPSDYGCNRFKRKNNA